MTAIVAATLGVSLVFLAMILAIRELLWLKAAQLCDGTVIELIKKPGRVYRPQYAPRIRFRAPDGSHHEFTRDWAASPPGYSKGDTVRVAYHPLTHDARIHTFAQRFGLATAAGVFGLAAAAVGFVSILGSHR